MRLQDILEVEYLPVVWETPTIGSFTCDGQNFGIVFKSFDVLISNKTIKVVDILVGLIIDDSLPISEASHGRRATPSGDLRSRNHTGS